MLEILLYAILGLVAGTLGALLGIGGGVILVPCLFALFSLFSVDPDYTMQKAIATSLGAMVVSTGSSTFFHQKKGNVEWSSVGRLSGGMILGATIGILVAKHLSSETLQVLFAVCALFVSVLFFKPYKPSTQTSRHPSWVVSTVLGALIAFLSSLLGLGGGFFMFPLLLYFHVCHKKAAATSSATSFLMSCIGSIGYMISFHGHASGELSLGAIYLPALIPLSLLSWVGAFCGVKIGHHIQVQGIRKVFAVTLVIVALLMILTP